MQRRRIPGELATIAKTILMKLIFPGAVLWTMFFGMVPTYLHFVGGRRKVFSPSLQLFVSEQNAYQTCNRRN